MKRNEITQPGDARITEYALARLMEGRLSRWMRKIKIRGDVAEGVLIGSIAMRLTEIQGNLAKVDLLLIEFETGETLIEYNGTWLEPGGKVTFEANDEVLIVSKMNIR